MNTSMLKDPVVYMMVGTAILIVFAIMVKDAQALSTEEYEALQAEQKMKQQELVDIKEKLDRNQELINESNKKRADLRLELGSLKQNEIDQLIIFAREAAMSDETAHLRDLKVQRINLLDTQSQIKQDINSINDDLRYGVTVVDESEVELVSSEVINLQIDISDLKVQLDLTNDIIDGIDAEILDNISQSNDYKRISAQYQLEHEAVKESQKKSWLAVTQFETSKKLADSFNTTVQLLDERKQILEDKRKEFINSRQTLITILEESEQKLFELDVDISNQKKLVGVQLSNTCKTLVKNNFTTNCPSYEDLVVFDTSLIHVTGKFGYDDSGFFHRSEPGLQNSWRFYQYDDELRVIVDPPLSMSSRMPMIIIENNLKQYNLAGERTIQYDMVNDPYDRKRTYHSDRYIDRCNTAVLSADQWGRMLTDTVKMLRTGCTETTIQSQFEETLPITEIDITTSPFWQYTQWLEKSKNDCKTICKQY